MEHIILWAIFHWAIFSVICTAGFFMAFHYNWNRDSQGLNFDFSDVPMTAFKVGGALLLGITAGCLMSQAWVIVLVLSIFIGICFGIAYSLKIFGKKS